MQKFIHISLSVVLILSFTFCSSSKKITQKNLPFKVINAYYNNWVGGQPGVKGQNITITIDNEFASLKKVYFNNMETDLKLDSVARPTTYIGTFKFPNTKQDFIIHDNSLKEFGNKPPKTMSSIPFKLEKNEAIISYIYKGQTKYYKIKNVQKSTLKLNPTKY